MTLIRNLALLICFAFVMGCNGDAGSKTAIPSSNASTKPPTGVATGTATADGAPEMSAGKAETPIE